MKGSTFGSEARTQKDSRTGVLIRQVTSHPSIHHHPFFIVPAYDHAMQRLFFVSHRSGRPQIYCELLEEARVVQLTDRPDLDEWSIYPSPDGRWVYFTGGGAGYRLDLENFAEEELVRFKLVTERRKGGVAGEMGTTALSRDGRWWALQSREGAGKILTVVDTHTGAQEIILRRKTIGHIQFCPDDPELLSYAGPHDQRLWLVRRDGSQNHLLYRQRPMQWVTHETWIPGRRELAFVDWPQGLLAAQVDSGQVRRVAGFNAWHGVCDMEGRFMVTDTNCPDIGIQVFNPLDGRGSPRTLCYPEASNAGAHWGGPFPYARGPIKVYALQHTHPHPSFSPDRTRVVFTSDRSGYAQVYEALVPPELIH